MAACGTGVSCTRAQRGCERLHPSVGPARAGSFWEGLWLLAMGKALSCVPEPGGSVWDLRGAGCKGFSITDTQWCGREE